MALLVTGCGLLGATGVVCGVVWLRSQAGQQWLCARLEAVIQGQVPGGSVHLGGLESDLWRVLELHEFTIQNVHGEPVLGLGVVRVQLEPWALLTLSEPSLHLESVHLDGAQIVLRQGAGGELELDELLGLEPASGPTEPWGGLPLPLRADELRLSEVVFTYADAEGIAATGALTDLRLEVSGDGRTVWARKLKAQARVDEPSVGPLRMSGAMGFVEGDLVIDSLDLQTANSKLGANGRVAELESSPILAMTLTADPLASADLVPHLEDVAPTEDLQVSASLNGPLEALRLSGQISGAQLGQANLRGGADLLSTPIAWSGEVETAGLVPSAVIPALTEEVVLRGRYQVLGSGSAWPDDVEVELKVDAGPQVLWGEVVDGLVVRGQMDDGILTLLPGTEAKHPLGAVTVNGVVDLIESQAAVHAEVSVDDLGGLAAYDVEGLRGRARFEGQLTAAWAEDTPTVRVDGDVGLARLTHAESGVSVERVSGPLQLTQTGDGLDLRVGVTAQGASVDGLTVARISGPVALSDRNGRLDLSARLTAEDVVGEGLRLAEAEVVARGGGSVGAEQIDVEVAIRDVRLEEDALILTTIDGTFDVRRVRGEPQVVGQVELGPLSIGSTGYQLDGGPVALSWSASDMSAAVHLTRSAEPFLDVRLASDDGGQGFEVTELGLYPEPGRGLALQSPARFQLVDGGVQGVAVDLAGPSGLVRLEGGLSASDVSQTRFAVDLTGLNLAHLGDLMRDFGLDPDGQLSGLAGQVRLRLDLRPEDEELLLVGSGRVKGLSLAERVEEVDLGLRIGGTNRRPELQLAALQGETLLGRLELEIPLAEDPSAGPLACDGDLGLRFFVPPMDSKTLQRSLPGLRELPEGRFGGDLRLWGPACDPDLYVVTSARGAVGAQGEILRLDARFDRHNDEIHFESSVEEGLASRMTAVGVVHTQVGALLPRLLAGDPDPGLQAWQTWVDTIELAVVPRGLELDRVVRFIGVDADVEGDVGGGLFLVGDPEHPTVTGGLLVMGGRIGSVPIERATFTLLPGDEAYQIEAVAGFASGGGLELHGNMPDLFVLRGEAGPAEYDGLALQIEGEGVPMALLSGLMPRVADPSGMLKVRGSIAAGDGTTPSVDVDLQLADAAWTLRDLGVRYEGVELDMRVRQDSIQIDHFEMRSRPLWALAQSRVGHLTGRARLALSGEGQRRIAGTVTMDTFWFQHTQDIQLALSGQLFLAGLWPELDIRGGLELAEGRLVMEEDTFTDASDLLVDPIITLNRGDVQRRRRREVVRPLWHGFEVDVALDLQRHLRLLVDMPTQDSYGKQLAGLSTIRLDAEVDSPEFKLRLSEGAPSLDGVLTIERGTARIMGAAFTLDDGQVTFLGRDIHDPILDLRAVRNTGRYGDVGVHITGSVSGMGFAFESDEYPDNNDILSLLLFGKPVSELSGGEGEAGAQLLSAALASVTGKVRRAVGVSFMGQLEIEAGAVRLGVPLSDRLFLTYEVDTNAEDDENINQLLFEWLIRRSMYAEFVTGDRGDSSADLFWRWRF